MTYLEVMEAVAVRAHAGQTRKGNGEPYVEHCRRVAAAARRAGLDEDAQAAALLHDTVEDTTMQLSDLRNLGATPRTIVLVDLLTKWWSGALDAVELAEKKSQYYEGIAADVDATALKLLDRGDNLRSMVPLVQSHRSWVTRYLEKTAREFPPEGPLGDCRNTVALIDYTHGRLLLEQAMAAPQV